MEWTEQDEEDLQMLCASMMAIYSAEEGVKDPQVLASNAGEKAKIQASIDAMRAKRKK
jgi:hypothetical protein